MKQLFVLLLLLGSLSDAWGQTKTYTLKECVEMGIRNNLSLRNSRVSVQKSKTAWTQSRARLLPVLSADFQMADYLMKPANVTTGALLGSDFPDDPTWQKIQSMQYAMTSGIQLGVPLYNQTILSATKVARTLQEISNLSYEKAVEDLTLQIGNVYYLAQASLEQQNLLAENIRRMEELCTITEELYKGGVVLEVDLTRVQINLKSLVAQHDQYVTLYEQQLNLLRFLLDLPPEIPMAVMPMPADVSLLPMEGVSESLPELRLLSSKQDFVSLSDRLDAVGYQEKFRHFFHTSGETHNWFGNTYLALSVQIPLFDGNDKRLKVRQYRYDKLQAETAFDRQRKQLDKEYADASRQLRHNLEVFRTQKDSYHQAEDVYEVTEEKYKEGVASMTELLQDEMRLRAAQAACVQAHCQCNVAQLTLLKLSGHLTELSR